jgi:hypothetical protein
MQEREAKLLSKSNDLEAIVIEQTTDKTGWLIRLSEKNQSTHYLVAKRGDAPRVFKTSDAALRCCERIGFHQIEVKM